jgi:hypothetical protein
MRGAVAIRQAVCKTSITVAMKSRSKQGSRGMEKETIQLFWEWFELNEEELRRRLD